MQSDSLTCLLDTNVILRFLLADHPTQSKKAKTLMSRIADGKLHAEIKDFVLLEVVWVLEASFRVPRDKLAAKLINILNFSGITNSNRANLIQALLNFRDTRIDLADCLLAASSTPATPVISFDADMKRLNAFVEPIGK